MTKFIAIALLITVAGVDLTAQNNTQMDSLNYSLGMILADNLKKQGFTEINVQALTLGINDALNGKSALSMEQANKVIEDHMRGVAAEKFESSITDGKDFLTENAKRPEVTVTPTGLQYEVLVTGDGPKPKPTQKVTTHYTGMLVDGQVFDSSVDRGEPATFPINGVIQGWQEALPMMNVGSKWKIYVPQELGYGERGAGNVIPPFATLIFEIELLEIAN
jgi:FKBP-type peptidyl-prolyl cis-trans isomerase FklB